ncbi:MAG TPA: aminotransferase class I/II-fold pyridoxal phosphate-dependent enzyme [Ilumatobacteraceae bacterium]|nr:aminotransferase class I/II-fold pyridoxal phosphate-dependent enzyme [Ilumatobacteraceae bacterium]
MTSMPSWKVLLSPPEVGETERELLLQAFDSGWVAPAGPDITAFEHELAELTGVKAVAALSSGTAAIHLALMAVGVEAGDDVLVSDLTFGASAFAVTYVGANPCFVDCESFSWHIDPDLLAEELAVRAHGGRLPAAVVAVDLYGSVADGTRLAEICAGYGVPLVEDAAEALGAQRDGQPAGRYGRVSILSFNGNKIVTTGGGGALASDDESIVAHARHLATQARQPAPWYEHREIGFNYRMGNLNAAVGRGQLRTLEPRIGERARVHAAYRRHLGPLPGVTFQGVPDGCRPNHWLTTVSFDPDVFGASPDTILARLRDEGIEARHGFKPMHMQPVFAGRPVVGAGGVSRRLFETSVSLPSGSRLTDADVEWICDVVASVRD